MQCPRCGKTICNCLLENPGFLARAVGKQLSQLESGEALGLSTPKSGSTVEVAVGEDQLRDIGGASTPPWLFDEGNQLAIQACGELITVDAAAADWNAKCLRYYTKEDDALKQDWDAKAVWCNPPYSATIIERFVRRALDAARHGTTTVCLLPWWNYPYLDLCEQHGRIHRISSPVIFHRQDGSTLTLNRPYSTPLVVVVFGPGVQPGFGAPIRRKDTASDSSSDGDIDSVHDGTNDGAPARRRTMALPELTDEERQRREAATMLIHGDAVERLKTISDGSVDVSLIDPPYPGIERSYGMVAEDEWHDLMDSVLQECRRILKPHGSVVVVIQPNSEVVGRMRLWPWRFVLRAAEMWYDWGVVQDVYSYSPNALPTVAVQRGIGLLRTTVKWCVWIGGRDCYRNQDAVLQEPANEITVYHTDNPTEVHPSGHRINSATFRRALEERGGVTPRNLLVFPTGTPIDRHGHPAVTPYRLAEWWCRYLLPPGGVLIDPFCGSGTCLLAGLDCGASQVIGIDKEEPYLEMARRRILGEPAQPVERSEVSSKEARGSNDVGLDPLATAVVSAHWEVTP